MTRSSSGARILLNQLVAIDILALLPLLASIRQFKKAVCLHPQARMARFQENETLIEWVNHQPLEHLLNCVGDGHSGVGNLMKRFNPQGNTREILDWFHLVENLYDERGEYFSLIASVAV